MPTEAKDIFEATSRSLRELTTENGLGLYIPPYQRPYGWDKRKVEKLLGRPRCSCIQVTPGSEAGSDDTLFDGSRSMRRITALRCCGVMHWYSPAHGPPVFL